MSEMVERVARRMASINCPRSWDANQPSPMSEPEREIHRVLARAAIEAMREPTRAMVCAEGQGFNGPVSLDGHLDDIDVEDVWRAMIDAALGVR